MTLTGTVAIHFFVIKKERLMEKYFFIADLLMLRFKMKIIRRT